MTTKTVKVKRGSIKLPQEVQKEWKDAEVYMRVSGDTAILKRVSQPKEVFDKRTVQKLKNAGKKISAVKIENAVRWARS